MSRCGPAAGLNSLTEREMTPRGLRTMLPAREDSELLLVDSDDDAAATAVIGCCCGGGTAPGDAPGTSLLPIPPRPSLPPPPMASGFAGCSQGPPTGVSDDVLPALMLGVPVSDDRSEASSMTRNGQLASL